MPLIRPVGQRLVKRPSKRIGLAASEKLQGVAAEAVRASAPFVIQQTKLPEDQVKLAIAAVINVLPEVFTHVVITGGTPETEADVCSGNACAPHYDDPTPECDVQCSGESACGAQACPYNSCTSHHCGGQECTQHSCSSESCPTNECGEESCRQLSCGENEGCDEHDCQSFVPCSGQQTEPPETQMSRMARSRLWSELVAEIAAAGPRAIDRARALQLEVVTKRT